MFQNIIQKLVKKQELNKDEISQIMNEILDGNLSDVQIAAFLVALRMKGETIFEITNLVSSLKEKGTILDYPCKDELVDIVGTGGDCSNTFNISTAAAFVVASGGIKVAKHGNRRASSKSGSGDVLEALGANIMLDSDQCKKVLLKTGICFMFATKFNPLIKNVAKARSEIKIRTIFNCLGPLINPSCAKTQIIGVYDKNLIEPVIYSMKNLNVESGMALFGEAGLDEASVVSRTYYAELKNSEIKFNSFEPEDFKIKRADIEDLKGGSPKENAQIMLDIFQNKIQGAKKDVVALNAALAFYCKNRVKTISEGLELAYSLIEDYSAYKKLMEFLKEAK